MSNNFRQEGKTLYVKATGSVASGSFQIYGNIRGVAQVDASTNDVYALAVEGVFNLPKVQDETWHLGDYIYWDISASKATNAAQTSGDPLIGVCVCEPPYTTAPQNPSDYGDVRLNPAF